MFDMTCTTCNSLATWTPNHESAPLGGVENPPWACTMAGTNSKKHSNSSSGPPTFRFFIFTRLFFLSLPPVVGCHNPASCRASRVFYAPLRPFAGTVRDRAQAEHGFGNLLRVASVRNETLHVIFHQLYQRGFPPWMGAAPRQPDKNPATMFPVPCRTMARAGQIRADDGGWR